MLDIPYKAQTARASGNHAPDKRRLAGHVFHGDEVAADRCPVRARVAVHKNRRFFQRTDHIKIRPVEKLDAQDADGLPHTDPKEILENQIKLMTYPVQWTNITFNMVKNGVNEFYECGTDDTLQKIVKRMTPESLVTSIVHTPVYEGKVQDFSIVKE